jgi:hypothetical protein
VSAVELACASLLFARVGSEPYEEFFRIFLRLFVDSSEVE